MYVCIYVEEGALSVQALFRRVMVSLHIPLRLFINYYISRRAAVESERAAPALLTNPPPLWEKEKEKKGGKNASLGVPRRLYKAVALWTSHNTYLGLESHNFLTSKGHRLLAYSLTWMDI